MPPKQQAHHEAEEEEQHTISDERKAELKDMLEEHGLTTRLQGRDLIYLDRAMSQGWSFPSNKELKAMKEEADKKHMYKNLVTYAIHSAREALGEPVKEKGHHEDE